jgi:hypothetical protein
MTERVKLYTSLPPEVTRTIAGVEVGAAYLAECVRSWRRAGFDVVSVNGAREIDHVRRHGYEAEYLQISRERPAIDDFLAAIRSSQTTVAGIINADVFLSIDPELLCIAVATDGMTLIERINIDPDSICPTGRSCFGFDAFVFATAPLLGIYHGEEFLFGHPWWDYWFPFAYAAAGGRLRSVKAPALFHLQHQLKWKQEHFIANGRKTVRCLLRLKGVLPEDIRAELGNLSRPEDMSESEITKFGSWCFAKLRAMAEPIGVERRASDFGPLGDFVALLSDPQNRTLLGKLDQAEARALAATELGRPIFQMSQLIGQQHIQNDEDVHRAVHRVAQILASRKATLSHFWALNVSSFERIGRAVMAKIPLRRSVRAGAKELAEIAKGTDSGNRCDAQ